MSDTVKGALIIGVCLMFGLWGAGWNTKGRYQRIPVGPSGNALAPARVLDTVFQVNSV